MSKTTYQPIVFSTEDLEPIVISVTVGDKEYTLREASGDAGIKWHNACTKCFKTSKEGGIASIEGLADTEALLVSLCLTDKVGRQVSINTIRGWPYKVQKHIFEAAKEISNLNEDEKTEEQLELKIANLKEKLDVIRARKKAVQSNGTGGQSSESEQDPNF
jgi:hypothetical protein